MGCGGSKAIKIKKVSEPVHVQLTTKQKVSSPKESREQPEGEKTVEQTTEVAAGKQTGEKHATEDKETLTKEQISLVQDTWTSVKEALELEQVGVEFYVRLFTDSPELLQLFSFRDINFSEDTARTDERLKKMALVTMQHVDLAVTSLNDLGSIVPALKDLGARHTMYNVKEHHFGPVGAALLNTLHKGLGDKFTSEVREAWTLVYGIVADTMKAGLKEIIDFE